jgi:hypothetical protein
MKNNKLLMQSEVNLKILLRAFIYLVLVFISYFVSSFFDLANLLPWPNNFFNFFVLMSLLFFFAWIEHRFVWKYAYVFFPIHKVDIPPISMGISVHVIVNLLSKTST